MVGGNYKYYKEDPFFYNCYIGDLDHTNFSNHIFCLYTQSKDSAVENKFYDSHYQINDTDYMYVYNVPSQYQDDYDTFVNSRYSKFSDDYKNRIMEFHDIDKTKGRYEVINKGERPVVKQILFPKDSDRMKYIYDRTGCEYEDDWEILDRIDEREIFDYDEYEKLKGRTVGIAGQN